MYKQGKTQFQPSLIGSTWNKNWYTILGKRGRNLTYCVTQASRSSYLYGEGRSCVSYWAPRIQMHWKQARPSKACHPPSPHTHTPEPRLQGQEGSSWGGGPKAYHWELCTQAQGLQIWSWGHWRAIERCTQWVNKDCVGNWTEVKCFSSGIFTYNKYQTVLNDLGRKLELGKCQSAKPHNFFFSTCNT